MRQYQRWCASACLLLCAACAGPSAEFPALPADDVKAEQRRQQIAQIRDYFEQLHRLDTVAFRLRIANRADCKDRVAPQIGLIAATPQSLPRKYRSFSAEALRLRWVRATVVSVVEGSPAGVAGIVDRDELMTFNNEPVPVTATSAWIDNFLRKNGDKPVQVVFKRDGEDHTVDVTPVTGCRIPVYMEVDAILDAHTDYTKIVINTGIMRLARTDDQLAAIVGHELAHVNMGHYRKKFQNEMLGQFGGALIDGGLLLGGVYSGRTFTNYLGAVGTLTFSVEFEREADYVGAYYAARAGYSIAGVEAVWEAFGLEMPASLTVATTHPISAVRFLQMRKTAEEIADKQRRGAPLDPELKSRQVDTTPQREDMR